MIVPLIVVCWSRGDPKLQTYLHANASSPHILTVNRDDYLTLSNCGGLLNGEKLCVALSQGHLSGGIACLIAILGRTFSLNV